MDTTDRITTGEIDFAYGEESYREARRVFENRFPGVELTCVRTHGPGGGWPVVTLSGHLDEVTFALSVGWDFEFEDIEKLIFA